MPARKNISSKLTGGRKGAPTRNPRVSEIDPNNLGSITLNRDAIQALTIAQAKVQVTISAGGTTAVLVSEETGKQIGGLDDLAKLLGLRAFVAKEKKLTASSDLQQEIITAAYRSQQYLVGIDPNFKQKKLDNSFILAAKPYRSSADMLEKRIAAIRENYHEDSKGFKEILEYYCTAYLDAIGLTLAAMVKGEKEKGVLDTLLFDKGVPAYIRNKLTMKSLVINKDTDLSRVLFPQDPSKGLALTVKEWQSDSFLEKQGWLLKNSEFLMRVLQDEKLVVELSGITEEQWSNVEDPRVQRVLKTRILVVPPFTDYKRVLEPLARPNFRGFGLPATAMDQSRDRLTSLCAVPIRAYAFSVRMAETITDFYNRIGPVGTIKQPDEKLGNYAKQMLAAIDSGTKFTLIDQISLRVRSTAIMEWIHRECKIIPGGDLSKKISAGLGIDPTYNTTQQCSMKPPPKVKVSVRLLDPVTSGAEKDELKSFRSEAFSLKGKTLSKKRTPASSVLRKEARAFLKFVAKEHSPLLAESMEAYFRGFYSEDIQSSAVRIAEARFDELDEVGHSDFETNSEESDSEDEAEDDD